MSSMHYLFLQVEAHYEVETRVTPIYHLVSSVLDEWAESLIAAQTLSH